MKDKVSVIINTLNENQKWLFAAASSYICQKHVEVQLIISTVKGDLSIETLSGLPGVEFCVNEKPGIYSQLNNAIGLIKNEWFCYAAGDDVAVNTKVIEEINACKKFDKKICASGFFITDSDLNEKNIVGISMPYTISEHLSRNMVSDCSLMKSSLLKEFAPFDLNCGNHGFWDFWLRIGKVHPEYFLLQDTPRWYYRQHSAAKHARRRKSPEKIRKNENERIIMLNKHLDLLKKYDKMNLLKIKKYRVK